MQTVAAAIGVLLMLFSVFMLAKPAWFVELAQELLGSKLRYLAALLRLLLGVVLLAAAPVSRYPLLFEVLGWLFVLGGLFLVVIPPRPLDWILGFIDSVPTWLPRLLAPLVFLFGGFVFYSFT